MSTQQNLIISEEGMRNIREAPDKWWNSLTWMEKAAIKSSLETLVRVGNGKMREYIDENFSELESPSEMAEEEQASPTRRIRNLDNIFDFRIGPNCNSDIPIEVDRHSLDHVAALLNPLFNPIADGIKGTALLGHGELARAHRAYLVGGQVWVRCQMKGRRGGHDFLKAD